jgi:hypothetical protein
MIPTLKILDKMRRYKGYPKLPMYTYTKLSPHKYSMCNRRIIEISPIYIKRFCEYIDLNEESTKQVIAYHAREKLSSYLMRILKIPESEADICSLFLIYHDKLTTEQKSMIGNTIFRTIIPYIDGLPHMFTTAMEDVKNETRK